MAQETDTDKTDFEDLDDFDDQEDNFLENPTATKNDTDARIDDLANKIEYLTSAMTRFVENQAPTSKLVPANSPFKEQLDVMQAMAKIQAASSETIIKLLNEGAKLGYEKRDAETAADQARHEAKIEYLEEALAKKQEAAMKNPAVEIVETAAPLLKQVADVVSARLNPGGAPRPDDDED